MLAVCLNTGNTTQDAQRSSARGDVAILDVVDLARGLGLRGRLHRGFDTVLLVLRVHCEVPLWGLRLRFLLGLLFKKFRDIDPPIRQIVKHTHF